MGTRFWVQVAFLCAAVVLGFAIFASWQAEHRERTELALQLAAAKKALSVADARQHERDSKLDQTLATIATKQRTVTTPVQIIRELPRDLPLPVPLVLEGGQNDLTSHSSGQIDVKRATERARVTSGSEEPGTAAPNGSDGTQRAVIPPEDLKPLYDFALACKACQARLSTAQGDLADEKAKETVLVHERDEAIQVARGGTVIHRIARAAKWLAIGAAAGALAAKLSR
ncbi:MAG: hypothetical protein NVS1B6_13580 [Steroidobacteraceae bacterium]